MVNASKQLPRWLKDRVKHLVLKYYQWHLDRRNLKVLFVLGHMRSGSSLLTHILASNPEIYGYGETHLQYHKKEDLARLALRVYWKNGSFFARGRYVVDKVLHAHIKAEELLRSPQTRIIFLVREPEAALPSILGLGLKLRSNEQDTLTYYNKRLKELGRYAQAIRDPERCFFLTYHQLLYQTGDVFEALRSFLDLKEPLTEQYETTWATGKRKIGTPGRKIKSGAIDRSKKTNYTAVSPEILARARAQYDATLEILTQHSSHVEQTKTGASANKQLI